VIDPIAFARKLIDIPSPTGEECAVGEFLNTELTGLGYSIRRHQVGDERFNLYAAAGGSPRVILNSHLDTVPPWFGSSDDREFLYGRGACDTKGVIAAMIAAGEHLRSDGIRDFAFLFVVGEETDSIGAKSANVQFASLGSQYVIVGEPTESKFARASKGALTCTLHFDGIAAHSAYPERGDSAIAKMIAAIGEIQRTDWGSHEILGSATVNVGVVRGGEKPNIIPSSAECELMFRKRCARNWSGSLLVSTAGSYRRAGTHRSSWWCPTARHQRSSRSTPMSRTSETSANRYFSGRAPSSTPTARRSASRSAISLPRLMCMPRRSAHC
jgi:acetylornithine deacetylase